MTVHDVRDAEAFGELGRVDEMLRVETLPLAGSALARSVLDAASGASWAQPSPTNAAEWTRRSRAIAEEFAGRDWLSGLLPALGGDGVPRRLRETVEAGGVVITTGQQPGLFGGPMYTWSKAFSALALADAIESATGVRAAPVFWAATDDSDLLEASSTVLAVPGGFERLSLPVAPRNGTPMALTPLGDTGAASEALRRAAGSSAASDVLEGCIAAYGPLNSVGEAYVKLLRAILEPLGIAVLDAAHPAVRECSYPLLLRALQQADEISSALRARALEIADAGHRPQVQDVPGRSLVFEYGEQKLRVPLKRAAEVAASAPRDGLSPNVLLRPVVERFILPTVAYVAGPSEVAYFAQVGAVSSALQAAAPLCVPRWSGRIIEPHIARVLRRLGVSVEDLRDPHALESRLAQEGLPRELRAVMQDLRTSVADGVKRMRAIDDPPVAQTVLDGASAQLQHRLDRLERRMRAAVKRRGNDSLHDLATARGSLFPDDRPQERVLNLVPLMARYGTSLLDAMLEQARGHAATLVSHG